MDFNGSSQHPDINGSIKQTTKGKKKEKKQQQLKECQQIEVSEFAIHSNKPKALHNDFAMLLGKCVNNNQTQNKIASCDMHTKAKLLTDAIHATETLDFRKCLI